MYGHYLAAVLKRALQPTVRITDGLQILAASAIPALAKATGLPVPGTDSILAYIGAAVVAFAVLRIAFVAPYQVWRDQIREIGALRLELNKPERMEIEHIARMRARRRVELARRIHLLTLGHYGDLGKQSERHEKEMKKIIGLLGEIAPPPEFMGAFRVYIDWARLVAERGSDDAKLGLMRVCDAMVDFLNGRVTVEALSYPQPQNIAEETRP